VKTITHTIEELFYYEGDELFAQDPYVNGMRPAYYHEKALWKETEGLRNKIETSKSLIVSYIEKCNGLRADYKSLLEAYNSQLPGTDAKDTINRLTVRWGNAEAEIGELQDKIIAALSPKNTYGWGN
jgi:hypothetical protein